MPTAKKCADVGTKPVSASVSQQHCKVLQDWYSTDHGSHTPLKDGGSSRRRAGDGAAAQKQTIVNVGREHRDGCAKLSETIERLTSLALLTMNGSWREEREEEKQSNGMMQREKL